MKSQSFKCKCDNIGSPKCINHYCKHCCDGLNCERHIGSDYPKTRKQPILAIQPIITKPVPACCTVCEKQLNYRSDNGCIEKNCSNCCQEQKCSSHFTDCICGVRVSRKNCCTNSSCSTNSCSGKCYTDSHCNFHFDTDEDLEDSNYIDYKVLLYKTTELPVKLITTIIDDYFDNRACCSECAFKFPNEIFHDMTDYSAWCSGCDKWVCSYECSVYDCDCSYYCNTCAISNEIKE